MRGVPGDEVLYDSPPGKTFSVVGENVQQFGHDVCLETNTRRIDAIIVD